MTSHRPAQRSVPAPLVLMATVAALAGLTVALLAQTPDQPQPEEQPTFRVEANFVRVDAYPMADGRPVTGLGLADFEIFEDGVPQQIESFEHVLVRPAGPQTERIEPDSARAGREMAADPRNRVFILFLDLYHVDVEGSHRIRRPLIEMLDRIIGPDDLVGVMTPEMSATQIALGRRTTTIENMLTRHWHWGERDREVRYDRKEAEYEACYVQFMGGEQVFRDMIERRREKHSLDAMQDLVRHLNGVREERKAIIAITQGYKLFRPDSQLARPLQVDPRADPIVPGRPEIYVDPEGKLRAGADPRTASGSRYDCDRDRIHLANLDNHQHFLYILDDANRANASFYPIDPRGLVAFDSPIGPGRPLTPAQDRAQLKARLDSLRTLAGATDGLAVLDSNDLTAGLKRVVEDLTSYYLLGYYSSNTELDGGFRRIRVRVDRPGVEVRARRGYRAATAEEVEAAVVADAAPGAAPDAAISSALATLSRVRRDARFRAHAAPVWSAAGPGGAEVRVVAELDQSVVRADEWRSGGLVQVQLRGPDDSDLAATETRIEPGARTAVLKLPVADLPAGEYRLQLRARPEGSGLPETDLLQFEISPDDGPEAVITGQPLLFRRGPATGNRDAPTADFRFRRNERLRIELPLGPGARAGSARVLDRAGQPLALPVALNERAAAAEEGRWLLGEVVLAPLAEGDYLLELTAERGSDRRQIVTGFRIVR